MAHSIKVARLIEKRRADGSTYLIGNWHGIRIFVTEAGETQCGQDTWEIRMSCVKPDGLAALATKQQARAERLTSRQAEAYYAGDRHEGARLGALARLHSTISSALEAGEKPDDQQQA